MIEFLDVVEDCFIYIFTYLEKWDLLALRRANKFTKNLVERYLRYHIRRLDMTDLIQKDALIWFKQNCPHLCSKIIKHQDLSSEHDRWAENICTMDNLKALVLKKCKLNDEILVLFFKICEKLETLSIVDCNVIIADDKLKLIGDCLPNLRYMQLYGFFSNVTDALICHITNKCSNLKYIYLNPCRQLTDAALTSIAQNLKQLKGLELQMCWTISDTGLLEVAQNCVEIEYLHLVGMVDATNASIIGFVDNCKMLKCLEIKGCWDITEIVMYYLASHCRSLEEIEVSGDMTDSSVLHLLKSKLAVNLKTFKIDIDELKLDNEIVCEIAKNCPKMEAVCLKYVEALTDSPVKLLAQNCTILRSFRIYFENKYITDDAVCHLAEYCAYLRELSVDGSSITDASLIAIAANLSNIRILSVNKCESVTDDGVCAVAEKCLKITKLNIMSCDVTDKSLFCIIDNLKELQSLNISYCSKITEAGLERLFSDENCPKIKRCGYF